MQLKKFDKILILLIGCAALFGGLRNWYFTRINEEITIDGHQVSMLPCKNGIRELFGNGLDSIGMCKCLLPKFYEFIKDDPGKIDRFRENGFLNVGDAPNDTLISLLRNCALSNLLDTTEKIRLGQYFKAAMTNKFRTQFDPRLQLDTLQFTNFMKCVFENMDGKITIKEYLADEYTGNDKIRNIITHCFEDQIKPLR